MEGKRGRRRERENKENGIRRRRGMRRWGNDERVVGVRRVR